MSMATVLGLTFVQIRMLGEYADEKARKNKAEMAKANATASLAKRGH